MLVTNLRFLLFWLLLTMYLLINILILFVFLWDYLILDYKSEKCAWLGLEKSSLEPLKLTSLKHITYKAVFRVTITTFWRCSNIQALKSGEGAVTVTNWVVTFVRQGLSKQDRMNYFWATSFVPIFSENKKLDPKRTLAFLKRTGIFKKNLER